MNTLENRIQTELEQAMKAQNKVQMAAMRSIKTAIMETRTAVGGKKDLEDGDIIKIIQKLAKQREESATIYEENGRTEQAIAERAELEVLNTYLPKMLSEEETVNAVKAIIAEVGATSMKDMGKVMGLMNKRYSGQIDGGKVAGYVKSALA